MSKIPKPVRKRSVPSDPSDKYLQQWKILFNSIDPERIKAFVKGDEEFPGTYRFGFDEGRLSDWYNVEVQLFISVELLHHSYGGRICCCLGDSSFALGWIYEDDENYDSFREEPITWKAMYQRLIKDIEKLHRRIPVPPKIVT